MWTAQWGRHPTDSHHCHGVQDVLCSKNERLGGCNKMCHTCVCCVGMITALPDTKVREDWCIAELHVLLVVPQWSCVAAQQPVTGGLLESVDHIVRAALRECVTRGRWAAGPLYMEPAWLSAGLPMPAPLTGHWHE
jgi:hypothetical protein